MDETKEGCEWLFSLFVLAFLAGAFLFVLWQFCITTVKLLQYL